MSAYISTMDEEPRRATVPVLYTRGTHYEVGYDIVSPLIHSISKKVGAVLGTMGNHHFPFLQIFPLQNLHRNGLMVQIPFPITSYF